MTTPNEIVLDLPERPHVVVNVALPFVQTFVRKRRRISEDVQVRRHHPIALPVIDPRDAPVAYRITPIGHDPSQAWSERPYDVRTWDGRFWWPVRDFDEVAVTQEAFLDLAQRNCHPDVLSVLGCDPKDGPAPPADRFFESVFARELLGSTFDRQSQAADRAAHDLAFCDGVLWAAAGLPVWYALHSFEIPHVVAGASLLFPVEGEYGLPRPYTYERSRAAAACRVLDISVTDPSSHPRFQGAEMRSRIDRFMPDQAAVADDVCCRALAERICKHFAHLHRESSDALRRHMPLLSSIIEGQSDDGMNHREVLAEYLRTDIAFLGREADHIPLVTDVLDRIAMRESDPLSQDEDDALDGFFGTAASSSLTSSAGEGVPSSGERVGWLQKLQDECPLRKASTPSKHQGSRP